MIGRKHRWMRPRTLDSAFSHLAKSRSRVIAHLAPADQVRVVAHDRGWVDQWAGERNDLPWWLRSLGEYFSIDVDALYEQGREDQKHNRPYRY